MQKQKLVAVAAAIFFSSIQAARADAGTTMSETSATILIVAVWVVALIALIMAKGAIGQSTWSLQDALSEPTEISAPAATGAAAPPGKITEMRASSSRLIAFFGALVILVLFLGFGTVALHQYAVTGKGPQGVDEVMKFLLAGMGLFAPYAVNKLSSIAK